MRHNVKVTGAQSQVRPKGADAFVRPCWPTSYVAVSSVPHDPRYEDDGAHTNKNRDWPLAPSLRDGHGQFFRRRFAKRTVGTAKRTTSFLPICRVDAKPAEQEHALAAFAIAARRMRQQIAAKGVNGTAHVHAT
jgi:hypothetical protein